MLKELKEKQQQEIDLQVTKQLQLNENARAMKQNQAAEIDRLVQVIDERNGDLGKKARLRKETKSEDSSRLHKVDKEVLSGSKTLGDIERPWLTPPSPLPSPPLLPPPSDPGENPEDDPFQMNPKKYHFSGTVQDGDNGYFVGWYIDQKTEKEKWGKMKIINEEQAQPAPPKATANETREEDITASQPQDILDSYSQPLQTPYITNAMNPLPNQPTQSIQPPYYHSTPTMTRNHDQKQANQPYFIDTSKPPPHVIQPQQNPYHREPSVNEEKVTMKRSNTAEEELQNVTVQLAKTQNEMMTTLAQNQIQLQENNTVMMTDLLSSHRNLYVLADIEVYDGKTAKLEDWLLQVEKASELTKIKPYEIAFAKSHGSPHKIIKTMGPGKSWNTVKTRLEESYSLVPTAEHASAMLCCKQKKDEPLVDYILRFAEHSYKTNGVDAVEEENKAIIMFFIKNLFNRDIRRRVAGAKNIRTLADAFKSAQHNLLKLKRYKGLNYDSNDEDDMVEGVETVNVVQNRVPKDTESANQIVDLPVSELPGTTENDRYLQDQGVTQDYPFWGTCLNCGKFGHKFSQCGKYGYGHNTPPHTQKTRYPNVKQHPSQYLAKTPIATGLQNVPISPNIQIQPDGTALLIQQLVNATKISQNAFQKTVENLNEIAEGTKMIKQQNDQIASVNKKIYNQQKKYDKNISQPKDNKTVRFQEKQEARNVGNYSATKKTSQGKDDRSKATSKGGHVNHITGQSESKPGPEGLISDFTPIESEIPNSLDYAISSSEDDWTDSEAE